MVSRWMCYFSIGLIFALAGCGATTTAPLTPGSSYAHSKSSHPDNWFHTWKFYVNNDINVPVRQFARDAHCMQKLPAERYYGGGEKRVSQLVETSHDPKCYLKESSLTLDYFAQLGGGYGTVKWSKPFFFNYKIESVSSHGLCFTIHNHDHRILVLRHC